MCSIITNDLSYSIGNVQILKKISLNVPEKSIYGYLGRNGAGKSTTIKLLLGLLSSDLDNIYIDNFSLKHDSPRINSIVGNLLESPNFYNKLSVYENLNFLDFFYKKGVSRIWEVLEITGLKNEYKKKAKNLSMGMKQRLGIAMSIFNDPRILILDEPLNGLDPEAIYELRNLFQLLNSQGKTVFLSSHILGELEKISSHIGIIEHGELIFQGQKEDLLNTVKKTVQFEVNQPINAINIIKKNTDNTEIKHEGNSLIIEDIDVNRFNLILKLLVFNNIEILEIELRNANLEEVFLNLINKKYG